MKKRVLSMLVLALLVTQWVMVIAGAAFNQSVLDGTVLIQSTIVDADGDTLYVSGTGFFVGDVGENPQYIITNSHVVEDFILAGKSLGGNTLSVIFGQDDTEEAYLVDYNYETDVAILKLAEPTEKRSALTLGEINDEMQGTQVYTVGFPSAADLTIQAVTSYGKNDATVTSGTITRLLTESGTGRKLLQTDAALSAGNSGGPMVDENGYVLGINTASSTLDTNIFYAVSVEEVITLLNKNSVVYALPVVEEEVDDSEPEVEEAVAVDNAIPEVEEEVDNSMMMILAGMGAVVVILVVVIVVVKSKKPKVAPQAVKKPVMRSVAVQHGGMTVPMGDGVVKLGRDNSLCKIVYQEGTPGVSNIHCQVEFNKADGQFIITDLGSTYGTFLTDGRKLAPSVSTLVPAGTLFYLGEKENMISLEME